jgi:broad specificity phosphatase PhoE
MSATPPRAVLVRHAETEWTLSGQHTGRTDLPLTDAGRAAAVALAPRLAAYDFALVLVSPSLRARETCELCGLGERAETLDDLREWDYGEYEGLTTREILARRPGWNMWRDGCPDGEDAAAVGARADAVLARIAAAGDGAVAVFSHGHTLRVLGARWIGLLPAAGALLGLAPGALCTLGSEREQRVLASWNETPQGMQASNG